MSSTPNNFPEILTRRKQLGPYPMEKLNYVDKITTEITGEIKRVDVRKTGFSLAATGGLGPTVQKEFRRFGPKAPITAGMHNVGGVFTTVADGEVSPNKAPLPKNQAVMSRHIKSLGYFLGADIVGICELPQWALFSHDREGKPIECNHKYAIVAVVDMNYHTMLGSTGDDWISASESFHAYHDSAHLACTMAAYIRQLGYPARANFQAAQMGNYQMALAPLCILAGIGELSRGGWTLNPFIGGRFKAAVITTDLPLQPDKPIDFGLQQFCRVCKKCAIACPSKAVSMDDDKVEHNGYMAWDFSLERCTKYRVANQNGSACGACVKACPWNKPPGWVHDTVRWLVRHVPALNGFIVKMDDVWGYGKQDIRYKWWFDFERKPDGTFHIAQEVKDNTLWQADE